jgi:hypothetical protein
LPCCGAGLAAALSSLLAVAAVADSPADVLKDSGIAGGLVVLLGGGEAADVAAWQVPDGVKVLVLEQDAGRVEKLRQALLSGGRYGAVSVDRFDGRRLPLIDNLVNLVVVRGPSSVAQEELLRVLCPGGSAIFTTDQGPRTKDKLVKPRPAEIDEWSHYLHDASNNAVARDTVVGPPRRLQWVGSPLYSRHHDRMSSVSAVVSAGGRVFTIFDEATPASILAPPRFCWITASCSCA